jgi:glycerol uptake facilitator protein
MMSRYLRPGVAWGEVPQYLGGQFLGAFSGAVLVYLAYLPHWGITEDPGLKLAVFSTGPAGRNPEANFVTEVIGTVMLLLGVLALGSVRTRRPSEKRE